jgi:hypothetical protein
LKISRDVINRRKRLVKICIALPEVTTLVEGRAEADLRVLPL